ncbi:MAG: methyl-accepting chemotaxis protein [Clostridia bacterium]|nr:methyl-accepting chemotaxis protein [Clostridia bacterium]
MKKLSDLKIGVKLLAGFMAVAMIAVFIGIVGYKGIIKIKSDESEISHRQLPGVQALLTVSEAQAAVKAAERTLLNRMLTKERRVHEYEQTNRAFKRAEDAEKAYESIFNKDEQWKKFKESWSVWKSDNDTFVSLCKELDELPVENLEAVKKMFEKLDNQSLEVTSKSYKAAKTALDEIIAVKSQEVIGISEGAERTGDSAKLSLVIALVIGVLMAVALGIILSISISRPIKKMVLAADQIALGDVDVRIKATTKDEVGSLMEAFASMADNIRSQTTVMERIALGDLTVEIKEKSEKDILSKSMKTLIETQRKIIAETEFLTKAAIEGRLDVRGNEENFKGDYKNIIRGVNRTLDAVVEPLKESADVLQELAKGNLLIKVEGDYKGDFSDIKNSLNFTIDRLNHILFEIDTAAEQVATGSRHVSESSQVLSSGSSEQASAIEEITASMTQIASQTKQNALSANEANELAVTAKNEAISGNTQMKDMLKSMETINEASSNISKIIKVIDEIAFQTNILALNAAVEAARAGQYGKGFAVVAEEVRNLAARSANAAKETTMLIEGTIKRVEAGTKIANETAGALDSIVHRITKAAEIVEEISRASNEQATGITQVNVAISQVSQVTQTNSATAEESAAASEELSSHADMLKDMVKKFKLKRADSVSNKLNELDPGVARMLEEFSRKKGHGWNNNKAQKGNELRSNVQINLSDTDFGKY